MTRYAIVNKGGQYVVVPHDRDTGDGVLVCYITSHIEAARKLAKSMQDGDYHAGRFRPTGKKLNPIFGWKE